MIGQLFTRREKIFKEGEERFQKFGKMAEKAGAERFIRNGIESTTREERIENWKRWVYKPEEERIRNRVWKKYIKKLESKRF